MWLNFVKFEETPLRTYLRSQECGRATASAAFRYRSFFPKLQRQAPVISRLPSASTPQFHGRLSTPPVHILESLLYRGCSLHRK
jgi:hypothetical protein